MEHEGIVPRELWKKAGEAGMLCCTVPEEYGGLGLDYLFDVVVFEEMARSGYSGPGFLIHADLVATYIKGFGSDEQKQKWLPRMVTGEAIGSLGMTEPHAGSDLKAIRTKAVRDGDDFIISGQKVFISNGQLLRRHRAGDEDRLGRRRQGRHVVPRRLQPRRLPSREEPLQAGMKAQGYLRDLPRRRARPRLGRCSASKAKGSS